MTPIDGRAIAAGIRQRVAAGAARLQDRGVTPTLAIVVATPDPAAAWYVRSLVKAAREAGVATLRVDLDDPSELDLVRQLDRLSADPSVHGIICQAPLPDGVLPGRVGPHISPEKDVDGANPLSIGRLATGLAAFAPATAQAVVETLRAYRPSITGATTVVVGRSAVAGKPAALLLLAEHATVTVCHSRTRDLALHTRRADILVAAAGRPHLLGAGHVKPGAVVIDVGTNPAPGGRVVGDVDTAAVEPLAGAVTPVPGGVGPVTTAVLLRNVVAAAGSQG